MTPDFVLTLGGVEFGAFEVPDSISAGGEQQLQTHKYSGGERTVDTFGADDGAISWSGIFFDEDAEPRCQQLDTIRKQGATVALDWSSFSYLVVVKSFTFHFERFYQIRYEISLEVVEDLVQPVTGIDAPVDDAIQVDEDDSDDLLDALIELVTIAQNILVDAIDLLSLPDEIAAIFTTLDELASVASASSDDLVLLGSQIAMAQATTAIILNSSDVAVTASGNSANFVSGNSPASTAQSIKEVLIYSQALANVFQLSNTLGRMAKNVAGITAGAPVLSGPLPPAVITSSSQQPATLAASHGDMLYNVAALVYRDAAGWTLLAKANGLVDPLLQSDVALIIPAYDAGRANDGILA